jgi:glycine/D-amino acid oxidase-like deaminating enzyme
MAITNADILIIGGGLYGCSTAYHLAKNGARNIVVLERKAVSSGGTAKSCAIVRTHYSIDTNMQHAVESLKVFANFDHLVGGHVGWHRTGYLIVGPAEHAAPMRKVFKAQNSYGIDTAELTPAEALKIHPLLSFHDVGVIGYDSFTGFADPYLTTNAYAARARELGVQIHTDTPLTGLQRNSHLTTARTPGGDYSAPIVILCAGPWTNSVAAYLGLQFPYEVSRHKVITLSIERPYQMDWPIVKDLTTPDKIYFRPETGDVVLVGTGDHGEPVQDADTLTDNVELKHVERISKIIANRMPAFANANFTAGWTGPYDISPDWNPLVGAVAGNEGLFVAVGFSGHGFKLAPTIGEALAQTVLGQKVHVPIADYDPGRFAAGKQLSGAYGIGSIS